MNKLYVISIIGMGLALSGVASGDRYLMGIGLILISQAVSCRVIIDSKGE